MVEKDGRNVSGAGCFMCLFSALPFLFIMLHATFVWHQVEFDKLTVISMLTTSTSGMLHVGAVPFPQ